MNLAENWFEVENPNLIPSPALLVYPDRIAENINEMIAVAGDPDRLRPHVKTYKMPEIVRMQLDRGITKFKCATIAEAEMTAGCGASDIVFAMQPVGPNAERFIKLKKAFPYCRFSCIADDETVLRNLSALSVSYDTETEIWIDLNTGMNRTGITPGYEAIKLYRLIAELPRLKAAGLHAYDGHIREADPAKRKLVSDQGFEPVRKMKTILESEGYGPVRIIAGGSPSFPVHAIRSDVELSPGTVLLWDQGYISRFTDMNFRIGAVLMTRIISKPAEKIICVDLGHKAVGSEMPQPRVHFPQLQEYEITGHNEEHMVIRTPQAAALQTGDILYAIPWHICPTVDRHDTAFVIRNKLMTEQWKVTARRRKITF